jgi:hypothetical protein
MTTPAQLRPNAPNAPKCARMRPNGPNAPKCAECAQMRRMRPNASHRAGTLVA